MINPKKTARALMKRFAFTLRVMRTHGVLVGGRFRCDWKDRWPCLHDATGATSFDFHYVYYTAWAARILARTRPQGHVDIGSCLRFATLVSAFVPIEYYDYRPPGISLSGLTSGHADVTALSFPSDSIPSLSCMHVVEHIGLERYGDPLDPRGDLKAMRELCRVLTPGGQLLFVVPVGATARIQYNAHRVYSYSQVAKALSELVLDEFALVTDSGELIENAQMRDAEAQEYGCGCFLFLKPGPQPK